MPLTLNAIQFTQYTLAHVCYKYAHVTQQTLVRNADVADRKTTLLIPV